MLTTRDTRGVSLIASREDITYDHCCNINLLSRVVAAAVYCCLLLLLLLFSVFAFPTPFWVDIYLLCSPYWR